MSELTAAEKDAAQRVGVEIGAEVLYEKWQDAERRLSAAEQDAKGLWNKLGDTQVELSEAQHSLRAAEARAEAAEQALREIADGRAVAVDGVTYVRPGQERARAALAGREEAANGAQ